MTLTASAPAKAACGCGGTCDRGGACGCRGAVRPQAPQRPRFFAGQLLTPEDLGLIVDYTVGKARLRNKLLFGDGVVCGLTVTCPPCGDGTVLVAPGFALDCCGNEIYVPCLEEVNVNQLVRELRLRLLDGWDCGDPCAARSAPNAARDKGDGMDANGKPKRPSEHYCLHIRYDEQEAEPVAPYVSDADCAQVACQNTRIVEGYRFELRCPGEHTKPPDILAALAACLGDLGRASETVRRAQLTQAMAMQIGAAAARVLADEKLEITEADTAALLAAAGSLRELANLKEPPTEARLRRYLADYEVAVISLARLRPVVQARAGDAAALTAARNLVAVLPQAGEAILSFVPRVLSDDFTLEAARELVVLGRAELAGQQDPVPRTDAFRMLQAGAPFTPTSLARLRLEVARIKAFLAERLSHAARLTRCDLRARLDEVRLAEVDDASLDGVSGLASVADRLAALLLEYMRDCFCLALNPPCAPPCEDPAVLLACLEVRDCEVVDICDMSRRFVLSATALRYWLPPLDWVGALLERACCDPLARPRPQRHSKPDQFVLGEHAGFFLVSQTPKPDLDAPVFRVAEAAGLAGETARDLAAVVTNLGALATRDVPAIRMLAERAEPSAATLAGMQRVAEVTRADMERSMRADAVSAARAGVQAASRKLRAENNRLTEELKKVSDEQAALRTQIEDLTKSIQAMQAGPDAGGTP